MKKLQKAGCAWMLFASSMAFAADRYEYDIRPPTQNEPEVVALGLPHSSYASFSEQVAKNTLLLTGNIVNQMRGHNRQALEDVRRRVFTEFVESLKRSGAENPQRSTEGLVTRLMEGRESPLVSETSLIAALPPDAGGSQLHYQADFMPGPASREEGLPLFFQGSAGPQKISSHAVEQRDAYSSDIFDQTQKEIHEALHETMAPLKATANATRLTMSQDHGNEESLTILQSLQMPATRATPYVLDVAAVTFADPYLALHDHDLTALIPDHAVAPENMRAWLQLLAKIGEGRVQRANQLTWAELQMLQNLGNPTPLRFPTAAELQELDALRQAQLMANDGSPAPTELLLPLLYSVGMAPQQGWERTNALRYPEQNSVEDLAIKRRILRLIHHGRDQRDVLFLGRLAINLCNPWRQVRCVDGVGDELTLIETQLLGANLVSQGPIHGGELISRILSSLKRQYVHELKRVLGILYPYQEVMTDTGSTIVNVLSGPLGLEGTPVALVLDVASRRDGFFHKETMAQRFITGETGELTVEERDVWNPQTTRHENITRRAQFNIPAMTVERLVSLLLRSRELMLYRPKVNAAAATQYVYSLEDLELPRMTQDVLTKESQQDPLVYAYLTKFQTQLAERKGLYDQWIPQLGDDPIFETIEILEAEMAKNPFFKVAPDSIEINGQTQFLDLENLLITPEFALYLLTKYQYVLTE